MGGDDMTITNYHYLEMLTWDTPPFGGEQTWVQWHFDEHDQELHFMVVAGEWIEIEVGENRRGWLP